MLECIRKGNHAPDGRLASEKELCEQLGVSRPLVRRALKELAQEGKIVSQPGKGHFVVSSNQAAPAGVVSVVLGYTGPGDAFMDPHVAAMLKGMQQEFEHSRFRMVWEAIGPKYRPMTNIIKPHLSELRGAVLVPFGKQRADRMGAALPAGIRQVVVGRTSWSPEVPSVVVDQTGGSRLAIRHLITQGHRRIACVTSANESPVFTARRQGYRDELAEAGLDNGDDLLVKCNESVPEHSGQAVRALLQKHPDVTAIFVGVWTLLSPCLSVLRKEGRRVANEVSIVCFDDCEAARHHVSPITVVRQPSEEMGRLGTHMLLEILDGKTPELRQITLSTELVLRH